MHDQKQSRFFDLPAELRNTIYSLVFAPDCTSAADGHQSSFPLLEISSAWPVNPESFLLSCKQVNSEAHGIYLSAYHGFWCETNFTITQSDTFRFESTAGALHGRLCGAKASDIAKIGHITLDMDFYSLVLTIRSNFKDPRAAYAVYAHPGHHANGFYDDALRFANELVRRAKRALSKGHDARAVLIAVLAELVDYQ